MPKKTTLLATILAALAALILPAAASAQQLVEEEAGALAVNAEFTATSVNMGISSKLGLITCGNVTVHYKISKNLEITSRSISTNVTTTECEVEGGPPVTLKQGSADMHLTAMNTGAIALTFVVESGLLKCHFQTPAPTPKNAPFTTNSGIISVKGEFNSPGCGPGEITATFALETADETRIEIA